MQVISAIFNSVGQAITSFSTALASGLTSITSMFYDAESGLTFVGVLLTIAMGCGIVYWGFKLVKGLIKHRGA